MYLNSILAEVEGDAVLFYCHGPAPSLCELVHQYERMVRAFETKRDELQNSFSQPLDLSLKIMYGLFKVCVQRMFVEVYIGFRDNRY